MNIEKLINATEERKCCYIQRNTCKSLLYGVNSMIMNDDKLRVILHDREFNVDSIEEYDTSNEECTLLKNSEKCYKILSEDTQDFEEYLFIMKFKFKDKDEEEE